jgi:hypothetical protein
MEKDVYVTVGNRQLRESLEEGIQREDYVSLIVTTSALEDTYQGFLENCCEALAQSTITEDQQPTFSAMREASYNKDRNVRHRVMLNNRPNTNYRLFDLSQRVEDSAGEFMYTTKHIVNNKEVSMNTLEMYVLSGGTGG